jgi:hypothetical protein
MKVITLSDLFTSRLYPQELFLVLISVNEYQEYFLGVKVAGV